MHICRYVYKLSTTTESTKAYQSWVTFPRTINICSVFQNVFDPHPYVLFLQSNGPFLLGFGFPHRYLIDLEIGKCSLAWKCVQSTYKLIGGFMFHTLLASL